LNISQNNLYKWWFVNNSAGISNFFLPEGNISYCTAVTAVQGLDILRNVTVSK